MKDNFSDTMNEALDEEYLGRFPKSARASLAYMQRMINESNSPADVALAMSVGMAFVLCSSLNPDKTLSIMLAASSHLAEKIIEDVPDSVEPAGRKFFEELSDRLDNMKKKGNLQ